MSTAPQTNGYATGMLAKRDETGSLYVIRCPNGVEDGPYPLVHVARILASFARITNDWEGHCPGPHTIELVEDYEGDPRQDS